MKKIIACVLLIIQFSAVFSAGEKRYVSIKKLDFRENKGNFSKKTGESSYGEQVTLVSEDNKWVCVQNSRNQKGWVLAGNLTKRKITGNSMSTNADELALAGKGFGEEGSSEERRKIIKNDFRALTAIENMRFSDESLLKFITTGMLNYEYENTENEYISTTKNLISAIKDKISYEAEPIFTPKQEYMMGRVVGAKLLAKYKMYHSEKGERYLRAICQTLTLNCDVPELYNGFSVFILDTDEINAFATPGGHILITRGLLKCADGEDELAAVIGHELGHILLQHSIKAIKSSRDIALLSEKWESAASFVTEKAGEIYENPKMKDVISGLSNSAEDMVSNFLEKGYSQAQEFEADAKAVNLMKIAGYNPEAIISMLSVLRKNEIKSGGMKNHPSADLRIKNISTLNILSDDKVSSEALMKRKERYETLKIYF